LCAFGFPVFVYRNVGQLRNHLAAPAEELDKSSSCKFVTSAAPAVPAKYAAELVSRAAGKAMKKKTEEHRSEILVRALDIHPIHTLDWHSTLIHPRELPATS
jgi:hypothetical protein